MKIENFLSSGLLTRDQALRLLSPGLHSPYLKRHRASLIVNRVQLVSALFAVLTPLWILIDYWTLDWPLWGILAASRVVSSLIFVALAWPWARERTTSLALFMLTVMLSIPSVFFLILLPFLASGELHGLAEIAATLYFLVPFIIVAGLAIFPLTAVEGIFFTFPALALCAYGTAQIPGLSLAGSIGTLWLLFLIIGVSLLAGITQLHYMINLVNQASHDPLTGVFTRRSGSEIMDLQFRISTRHETCLTLLFMDIDNFKLVNDTYGHDAGDRILREVADRLRQLLRRGDILIRWGGEEFLVVLVNTDFDGAREVLRRLLKVGLGKRPDGSAITVSIGAVERRTDVMDDWPNMVELADHRMYQAKFNGKARCVFSDDNEFELLA